MSVDVVVPGVAPLRSEDPHLLRIVELAVGVNHDRGGGFVAGIR